MIIKLQLDKVVLFWDMIRKSMIESSGIPEKFQQDYSINILTRFLSGMLQAWVGYKVNEDGTKKIHTIFSTSIIDEKFHGVRILNTESIYGFRLIDEELISEMAAGLIEYAKANKCNAISAEYTLDRVKNALLSVGFKIYKTTCLLEIH